MPSSGIISNDQKAITHIGKLVHRIVRALLRPTPASMMTTAVFDLSRSKTDLISENALLRYQLILLKRQTTRPKPSQSDRLHHLPLAKITRTWQQRSPCRVRIAVAALPRLGVAGTIAVASA